MAADNRGLRSTLEEDNYCELYPRGYQIPKSNVAGVGMDVCDNIDSGVGMLLSCEVTQSFGVADPVKPATMEPPVITYVSVGYSSVACSEDIKVDKLRTLEGQMEGLYIDSCEAVTTTTPSRQLPTCSVDRRLAFVDQLQRFFTQDDDGDTKLHLAVISQNTSVATYLMLAAASCASSLLDLQNYEFRQTALHLAVITDQPEIVRLLVNCGASCDVRDRHGNTPLHLACSRGLVRCIVEMMRGFSDEEQDQLAEYCHHANITPFQLPPFQLPNLNAIDYEGVSCLHMVAGWKSPPLLVSQRLSVIHFLVHNCGADVNIQECKSGHSLLHLAVKQGDIELFTYLLKVPSINVNLPSYSRRTALDIADMLKRYDMVQLLMSASGCHSNNYVPDSGSESDDMDDYDDLMIAGQKFTGNSCR